MAAFRILFGGLMFASTVRFFWHGWIDEYYAAPTHFFHYWAFSWVRPFPLAGMYLLYAAIAASALLVALGLWYRAAAWVFALAFGYAHFCDKANYLNHYYLVSLLGVLCALLPLDREYSLRVLRRPEDRRTHVRAWVLYLLRFQVGIVYLFGGVAKLGSDWLLRGEPLRIWLAANAELPLIGRYLASTSVALAFSWAGAAFDLSIVLWLSWQKTRRAGYAVLVCFHLLTALLFRIGMFPWIMTAAATLFLDPAWPARLLRRAAAPGSEPRVAGHTLNCALGVLLPAYAALQLLLPLRSRLYPGNTLWSEEGFRFAWKVMLIEKSGALELEVVDAAGRRYSVAPREYLTPFQARMAATQPDMILELAHWVATDFERRGVGPVRVYADSEVSFNGRRRRRLLDPAVDLAAERDTLAHKSWILPAPAEPPLF